MSNGMHHKGSRNSNQQRNNQQNQNQQPSFFSDPTYQQLDSSKTELFEKIREEQGFCDENGTRFDVMQKIEDFAKYLNCVYLQNTGETGVTSSSIRNIFENYISIRRKFQTYELEMLNNRIKDSKQKAFEKIRPQLISAKAKVNYLVERKLKEGSNRKDDSYYAKQIAYINFREFIKLSTDKITTSYKQFEAFMELLETLIAFMK
ncbi:hypothetical protein Calow_2212 [Caldicellulosiruptor owensensis OL]|uniref:CRISPR type III A-associated protein Csm2 n=1 Tax=Caldicellulosiruptor owensensis (strain ATCC 700167 / DSM 13100 / OL) TaxID=632518 RepID=E4Q735_CALOW|nr:hypothetical protein [Caldicellulosiruptor owensensis]ADQ05715.1 hypothetical protein Calow_2212 [Caldicellulosiruptor owensensis OL]